MSIIGSGTYGYVFKPSLPIVGKSNKDTKNMVSKLMYYLDALTEYNIIKKLNSIYYKTIPNFYEYFALENCKIENVDWTRVDKNVYNCQLVMDNDIDDLVSLQIPYAGISINDYFSSTEFDIYTFVIVVNNMINLLKNGIIPLNEQGIYHQDIKGNNILIENNIPKIIDWSITYINKTGKIVDASDRFSAMGSPNKNQLHSMRSFLMYNTPISASFFFKIAFDNEEKDLKNPHKTGVLHNIYRTYFENYKSYNKRELRYIRKNYINNNFNNYHFNTVIDILNSALSFFYKNSYNKNYAKKFLSKKYLKNLHKEYIKNDNTFDDNKFYKDYHNNLDIWGWVISFRKLLTRRKPININNDDWNLIKQQISKLIIYIFNKGAIEIKVNDLTNILQPILDLYLK